MSLSEETGVKAPIRVRAGGSWGLPTLPPPSQILGNPDFGAAREILAKPIFTKVSMFRFVFLFLWEVFFFLFYGLSRRGKAS